MFDDIFVQYWWAWVGLVVLIFAYRGRRKKESALVPALQRRAVTGYHDSSPRTSHTKTAPHVPRVYVDDDVELEAIHDSIWDEQIDHQRRRDSVMSDGHMMVMSVISGDTGGSRSARTYDDHRTDRKDSADDIPASRDDGDMGGISGGDGGSSD